MSPTPPAQERWYDCRQVTVPASGRIAFHYTFQPDTIQFVPEVLLNTVMDVIVEGMQGGSPVPLYAQGPLMVSGLTPNQGIELRNGDAVARVVRVIAQKGYYPAQITATMAVYTGGGTGYVQGARVYNSVALNTVTGVALPLTFDNERYDTDDIHSVVLNTDRLTCRTAGKYLIVIDLEFAANVAGIRAVSFVHSGGATIASVIHSATPALPCRINLTTIFDLAVNDWVRAEALQTSGGALAISAGPAYTPEFMMQRVG